MDESVLAWGLVAILILVVIALWGAWNWYRHQVSLLVGRFVDAASRLQGGDLTARVGPVPAIPTLRHLAFAFDDMADAVERSGQSQAALNAQLEALLANAPVGFAFLDAQCRFLRVNEGLSAMDGVAVDDHPGRSLTQIMPGFSSMLMPLIATVIRTGAALGNVVVKGEIPARPGQECYWLCAVYPVTQADGGADSVGIVTIEASDRVVAERALRSSAERLNFALEGAQVVLWDYDVATGEVSWLGAVRAVYGWEGDYQPDLQTWLTHVLPEDRHAAKTSFDTLKQSGRGQLIMDFRIDHPKRGIRWVAGLGHGIRDEQGRLCRLIGLNIDITPQKEAEATMQHATAQAEAASRAKSAFLAAASHDLRQPTQSLMLFTTVLAQALKDHPVAPVVAQVERSLESLRTLLDELLDISRLDAGTVTPRPKPFVLAELMSPLVEEYGMRAKDCDLVLKSVPCHEMVNTDPVLLERIMRNLIENALRYTYQGRILVGARRGANFVRVEIHDTGIGISTDQHEAVFQEFYQIGNLERDRSQGLGLGLPIVRRLGQLLGLDIRLTSREGKGSCFSIKIPLARS